VADPMPSLHVARDRLLLYHLRAEGKSKGRAVKRTKQEKAKEAAPARGARKRKPGAGRPPVPDADGCVTLRAIKVPEAVAKRLRERAVRDGVTVDEAHRRILEAALGG